MNTNQEGGNLVKVFERGYYPTRSRVELDPDSEDDDISLCIDEGLEVFYANGKEYYEGDTANRVITTSGKRSKLKRSIIVTEAKPEENAIVNPYSITIGSQFWECEDIPFGYCIVGRFPKWEYIYSNEDKRYCPYVKTKMWMEVMKFPIGSDPLSFYITSMDPTEIDLVPNFYFFKTNNPASAISLLESYSESYNSRLIDTSTFKGRVMLLTRTNSLVQSIKERINQVKNFSHMSMKEKCDKVRRTTNLHLCCRMAKGDNINRLASEASICIREVASFLEDYAPSTAPPNSYLYIPSNRTFH